MESQRRIAVLAAMMTILSASTPLLTAADAPIAAKGLDAAEATVDELIRQADSPSITSSQRNRMLDEAVASLNVLVERLKSSTNREGQLRHFQLRLKLIELAGLTRPREHAQRIMGLGGNAHDRKALAEMTAEPLAWADALEAEIDRRLPEWSTDLRAIATDVSSLEDAQRTLDYKSAWLHLYRALGDVGPSEREQLLTKVISLADRFAKGDASSGVKYWSLLLCGRTWREKGRYDQSAACLSMADDAQADTAARGEAKFEAARNLIEQAKSLAWLEQSNGKAAAAARFDKADAAIKAYADFADKTAPKSDEAELRTALLRHLLLLSKASCPVKPDEARQLRAKAQEVLVELAVDHPDWAVRSDLLADIADKYAGAADANNLNSVVLLALSGNSTSSSPTGKTPAELVRLAMERQDEASIRLRPLALWRMGLTLSEQDKLEAAEYFTKASRAFADDSLARISAVNAVVCYNGAVAVLVDKNEPIPADLRGHFIEAMEFLIGRWGQENEVASWYFDLAWQRRKAADGFPPGRERLALLEKAQAAYERTPTTSVQYMEARKLALELRCQALRRPEGDEKNQQETAETLVKMLWNFGADASAAAAKTPAGPKQVELRSWGAWADFTAAKILYDVLDRHDEAMAALRDLPSRWVGTVLLADIAEFEIEKLFDQGREDEAIEQIEVLVKDDARRAGKAAWGAALAMRKKLPPVGDDTDDDPTQASRQRLLKLARIAYENSSVDTPQQKKSLALLTAGAMLDCRLSDQALPLLLQCGKADEEKARKRLEEREANYANRAQTIKAANLDSAKLLAAAKQFFQDLADAGLEEPAFRQAVAARKSMEAMERGGEDGEAGTVKLSAALQSAYEELAKAARASVSADAEVLESLARAYEGLKKYEEAAKLYRRLVEGIDRKSFPQIYWRAEYAYCRCLLAGWNGDMRAMKSLSIRIAQLKAEDSQMGGLAGRFEALASEAARRVK